jgi:predicted TIM-barrel fold metal-dependent hydrolase
MTVIDVQVHAYERNHPGRPWVGHLHGPQSANGEEMVAAMDAVGVDGAIIVSTFNLYRYDPSYALEVYANYPERFRVVKPIDPANPAVDEIVDDWAKTKGAVGVRLMLRDEQISDPTDPRLNRAFAAAGRHGVPVNFLCWGRLDDGAELVRRNPDTVIVVSWLSVPARPVGILEDAWPRPAGTSPFSCVPVGLPSFKQPAWRLSARTATSPCGRSSSPSMPSRRPTMPCCWQ